MCEEGVKPDDITFVCLLSACSHVGLVDEGMCCYVSMITVFMISPKSEHYSCMVDLLGHVGKLHEIENMIKVMPGKPYVHAWRALLGACKIHGNVEMGECVAKQFLELEPTHMICALRSQCTGLFDHQKQTVVRGCLYVVRAIFVDLFHFLLLFIFFYCL